MSRAEQGQTDPPAATPPLRRHPALVPLSREHMSGLVAARNLDRAAGAGWPGPADAALAFNETWRAEIREHFDDEERLLVPLGGSPELIELGRRLVGEHSAIRALAADCGRDPAAFAAEPGNMRRLASLLRDHIRWEEREYFEAVQREHPGALDALEHEAEGMEQRRPGARARTSNAARAAGRPGPEEKP